MPLEPPVTAEAISAFWIAQLSRCSKTELNRLWNWFTSRGPRKIYVPSGWFALSHGALIAALKQQPDLLFDLSPRQFELLIAALLFDRGFTVHVRQATHDGGIDMLAYLDTGVSTLLFVVQVKRYRKDRPVGVETVRELYAVVTDRGASQGMIVTTSSFTRHARAFAQRHEHQLSLQGRDALVRWIYAYRRGCF